MQSINQIWPRVAGKRNFENVIFILLLAPPCKFWLPAGHWWRAIPYDKGPEADCRRTCCVSSVPFKKKNQHSILKVSWAQTLFRALSCIVTEPKPCQERLCYRGNGKGDHFRSQDCSSSSIHTWKPKDCPPPQQVRLFCCLSRNMGLLHDIFTSMPGK